MTRGCTHFIVLASYAIRRCGVDWSPVSMKPSGSIWAYPNPIHASHAFEGLFPLGRTTLSWDSHVTDAVEVHVDSPSDPLLSCSRPSGSAKTGPWVRDGMVFHLQDVSGGLACTSSHTLATVAVGVATLQGATTYRQWQTVFEKLRRDLVNLLSLPDMGPRLRERAQETSRNEPRRETRIVVLSGITPNNLGADAMLTFGFSYHSGIFPLSSETPFLGMYHGPHYEQKMRGVAELYDLPWLPIPFRSTSPGEFSQILKRVLDHRLEIVDQLRTKQAELRTKVEETRRRFLSEVAEMRVQRQRLDRT